MSAWQPGQTLEMIEKNVILQAFRFYQENKTQTANSLGIAIRTLDSKLEKYSQEASGEEKRNQEQREVQKANELRAKGPQPATSAPKGDGVEPTQGLAPKSAMPLPERKEVQGLSSRHASVGGPRSAR